MINDDLFISWLKKEVSPALGCTEPVAVAYATAYARQYLDEPCLKISGFISANLYKNAMAVTIPGTTCAGVDNAVAIGFFGGNPDDGLQTLAGLKSEQVDQALTFVKNGGVQVVAKETPDFIHIDLTLQGQKNTCRIVVTGTHTNIVELYVNDIPQPITKTSGSDESEVQLELFSVEDAFNFINNVELSKIEFILEAARLNGALSEEGRKHKYGLNINGSMAAAVNKGLLSNDLMNQIVIETVAASDARMGGAPLSAVSNYGSGNQGIAATIPVMVVAKHLKASTEDLTRALAFSHLTAISIHSRYTRLSAFCAASTAAMGAAAGMVWLFSKNLETVHTAIINMVSDVTGIICDGASNSCAMKVSTVTVSSFKAVMMALDGIRVGSKDGIVTDNAEETINNLCRLVVHPMVYTDKEIIDIMSSK